MLSTMERVLFLRSVEVFGDVAGEDLASIAEVSEEVSFHAGEAIVRQGEPGDGLYVIVDGGVSIIVEGSGQVAVRGPGNVVGEMAVLSGRPRAATCVAVGEVLALRLLRDDFLEIMTERQAVAVGVVRVLTERLDEATQRLASMRQPEEQSPPPTRLDDAARKLS
jgi:CRP-like cAMP-binding protein